MPSSRRIGPSLEVGFRWDPGGGRERFGSSRDGEDVSLHRSGRGVGLPGCPPRGVSGLRWRLVSDGIRAEEGSASALLETVKMFHYIAPEEESDYRDALLAAYRAFVGGWSPMGSGRRKGALRLFSRR